MHYTTFYLKNNFVYFKIPLLESVGSETSYIKTNDLRSLIHTNTETQKLLHFTFP